MPKRFKKNNFNYRPAKKQKLIEPIMNSRINQVLPNLYIGSMQGRLEVTRFEIKHIVSLISRPFTSYPVSKRRVTEHFYKINDSADANLKPVLDDCLPKIHDARQANENVLVHCRAGVSRSASVVIAYLMRYENMDFTTAIEHLRKIRPCINPNYGFQKQLQSLDSQEKPNVIKENQMLLSICE